ncbi:hypothetical protein GC173_05375 [bacterium]|nr:hypothetical protein [bacterium]
MTRLFASHGSDEFNDWMEMSVSDLADDVRGALGENLVALVLGGGYARGEGGVVYTALGERPYNDLDFSIVVKRRTAEIPGLLAPISKHYASRLGIDVDFSRPLTLDDVRHWPHWLMWSDLLAGHRVVVGPQDVLTANAPARLRESPPLIEATRLMLNRGAGLLWSLRIRRGLDAPHDSDFLRRNVQKCWLAMGDAIIIMHRAHQTRYEGRDDLLARLISSDARAAKLDLLGGYRGALEFRLRPGDPQPEAYVESALIDIADLWGRVWILLEEARTGRSFSGIDRYTSWRGLREPELHSPVGCAKNLVRNVRRGRLSLRYPREELYRALPRLLCTHRGDTEQWKVESAEFLSLWRRYN